MADLEKLIRDRQDELRGRPRDWIDDFTAWHRRMDWVTVGVVFIVAAPFIVMTIWIMVQ
jgi:hypothetical protein